MASIGASYAGIYVSQKRQIEKMERREAKERSAKRGESRAEDVEVHSAAGHTAASNKKVHPLNFQACESAWNEGKAK